MGFSLVVSGPKVRSSYHASSAYDTYDGSDPVNGTGNRSPAYDMIRYSIKC